MLIKFQVSFRKSSCLDEYIASIDILLPADPLTSSLYPHSTKKSLSFINEPLEADWGCLETTIKGEFRRKTISYYHPDKEKIQEKAYQALVEIEKDYRQILESIRIGIDHYTISINQ